MPNDYSACLAKNAPDSAIMIAAGLVNGVTPDCKFGANPAVGSTIETVWDEGGLYTYLAAASVLKVSSSSADDASAGTGARTVTIYGCDGDYDEVSESVSLNGQTAVNTTTEFLRVWRVIVDTAGSGATNAGDIYVGDGTVTAGVPATKYAKVLAGNGQSLMALRTVPAGKKMLVSSCVFGTGKDATNTVTVSFWARPLGGVWNIKEQQVIFQSTHQIVLPVPVAFGEKVDFEARAVSAAGTPDVAVSFSYVLIDV